MINKMTKDEFDILSENMQRRIKNLEDVITFLLSRASERSLRKDDGWYDSFREQQQKIDSKGGLRWGR